MPVYSMTGYASVQQGVTVADGCAAPGPRLVLEIRSVNSRHLDLAFRLPEPLRTHEALLRTALTQRLQRGKVEVRVALEADGCQAQLQRLAAWQATVQASLPQARGLSVAEVLRLCADASPAPEQALDWCSALPALLERALEDFLAARAHEGQRLAAMLLERCAALRQLAAQAQAGMPQLLEQQRQRFLERWREALGDAQGASEGPTEGGPGGVSAQAAQERALLEAASHALRADVAEEVSRLNAHLDAIETPLQAQAGVSGKRLEFLIQELHREANTLGAKSSTLEMTRISVDMRVLIEQMREQVQNLE